MKYPLLSLSAFLSSPLSFIRLLFSFTYPCSLLLCSINTHITTTPDQNRERRGRRERREEREEREERGERRGRREREGREIGKEKQTEREIGKNTDL